MLGASASGVLRVVCRCGANWERRSTGGPKTTRGVGFVLAEFGDGFMCSALSILNGGPLILSARFVLRQYVSSKPGWTSF